MSIVLPFAATIAAPFCTVNCLPVFQCLNSSAIILTTRGGTASWSTFSGTGVGIVRYPLLMITSVTSSVEMRRNAYTRSSDQSVMVVPYLSDSLLLRN